MRSRLSIVLPVLNEEPFIAASLDALAPARAAGFEIIVADGGSDDATRPLALPRCDCVIAAPRGRASQMNAGAAEATGDILLFLHADTRLPQRGPDLVREAMDASDALWGRFDVAIDGRSPLLPLVAATMNIRSRRTGIATGDQAIFVRRQTFERIGGFPDIPLMEDIALSRRLKRESPPLCLRDKVVTSGRRWEKNGVMRTIVTMWRLRAAYYFGADPADLARAYGYAPRQEKGPDS